MKKPRLASREISKKIIWNRYRYPTGLIDTTSFQSKVCWWNYAALSKTSPNEPLGLDLLARHCGWSDCVAVGLTQNWEVEKLKLAARNVLHVALSPYLAWVMSQKKNLWCQTVYIPASLSCDFAFPEANWVLLKILEIADAPWSWLETAQNNTEDWIYVLVDRALKRRLHDIHPQHVLEKFSESEWTCELLLMESQEWIGPESKIWIPMLERKVVPMLFRRKQNDSERRSLSS